MRVWFKNVIERLADWIVGRSMLVIELEERLGDVEELVENPFTFDDPECGDSY